MYLSFFIFMNYSVSYNMSIVKVYSNFNFLYFCLNFFIIPFIACFLLKLFQKYTLIKELHLIIIYGIIIILFLIFNCILVSSFCGIYINSDSKLAINVIFSIFGANFFALIFYLFGALLKKKLLSEKISGFLFIISNFFNPLNLSFNDKIKCTI